MDRWDPVCFRKYTAQNRLVDKNLIQGLPRSECGEIAQLGCKDEGAGAPSRLTTGYPLRRRSGAFYVLVLFKNPNRSMLAAYSVFGDQDFLDLFLRGGVIHHIEHGFLKYRA